MIKGRELDSCSRGPTLLAFRSRMRCRIFGDAQLYDIVVKVERPLLAVLSLRGNHPPILLASASMYLVGLSSDSRSRMCSEEAHPLRTFTMHRIAVGCRLVLFSINACQSIYNCATDYSPAINGGGSDLASTLSILHAIEPCGRSLRLLGRWALPLIQIRGSETDVSSFAHWRVPFGRRVLSYDPRPHPDAGGNDSHLRELRALWQVTSSIVH
jgi:hypothetical protein